MILMKRTAFQLGGFLFLLFLPYMLLAKIYGNSYFLLFALIWFIFIGILVLRWIRTPLKELLVYLDNLRQGIPLRTRLTRKKDLYGRLAKEIERFEIAHTSDLSALRGRMEEIQAILSSMSEGVIATEVTGRISLINPVAAEIFGLSPNECLGEFPHKLFAKSELSDIFHQVYVKGKILEKEISWGDAESAKTLNLHLAPIRDDVNEEMRGVVAVINDITQLRKLESMRRDFVANVSHELKTPLTSIKGFIETLLDGAIDDHDAAVRFLNISYQEAERLNNLIHDLLDISRLETGENFLNLVNLRLDKMVTGIIVSLQNQIQDKNISVEEHLDCKNVYGDEGMLKEVFLNLIENAIKYNLPGGRVIIRSRLENNCTIVEISDNGFGIPEESLPRIFERFYRVDKGRSREMGGTGLGLSIVKHIIERHNGKVRVESTFGKGSCFIVTLPNLGKEKGKTEEKTSEIK